MNNGMKVVAMVLAALMASAVSAAVFESDFSGGVAGASIGTLDEWSVQFSSGGAFTEELTADGQAHTTSDASGWIYNVLRADASADVAQSFSPTTATGLRYEMAITDQWGTAGGVSGNGYTSIVLSETSNNAASVNYVTGEKLVAQAQWSRATSGEGSGVLDPPAYFTFRLGVINRYEEAWDYHLYSADGGYSTIVNTVAVNIFQGDYVRMCLEVRDGAGDDVRVGYQVYDAVVDAGVPGWGDWEYGDWQDPTAAPDTYPSGDPCEVNVNAFESDWKTRWAGDSYMYVENYAAKNYGTEFWMDDVVVTPEPATLGLLVLGGLMIRRKRRS
jgi:hypothetical protein